MCFTLQIGIFDFIFLLPGRPTEIDEKDVYLCEERYNEHDKDFKKLKGLKVIFIISLHMDVHTLYP